MAEVLGQPSYPVLLLRSVEMGAGEASSWDFDLLANAKELSDDARRLVLGSRRKVVFVEGDPESLDQPIYSALFKDVTVRAVGSSSDVERSVAGLRTAMEEHWLHAFGIVDGDQKREEGVDLAELETRGIYPLDVYSIESLYYGERARRAVAEHQASIFGWQADAVLDDIAKECLSNLADEKRARNLISYRVMGILRGTMLSLLPSRKDVAEGNAMAIDKTISIPTWQEESAYSAMVRNGDLESLIARYKIRESGVRSIVAKKLDLGSPRSYEALVVHLVKHDQNFRADLLSVPRNRRWEVRGNIWSVATASETRVVGKWDRYGREVARHPSSEA